MGTVYVRISGNVKIEGRGFHFEPWKSMRISTKSAQRRCQHNVNESNFAV